MKGTPNLMIMPRVFVTVPGVESLTSVIDLLRAAGAQITTERREFVVNGPLTTTQAAAVWLMATHVDGGGGSDRLRVRVEPAEDLRATLDAMCPGDWFKETVPVDWTEDEIAELGVFADFNTPQPRLSFDLGGVSNMQWWEDQQRLQRELRGQAAPPPVVVVQPEPAEEAPEVERRTDGTCCGQGGSSTPGEGQPVVVACMLCPRSGTYWRIGRTPRSVCPLGEVD